MTPYWVLKRCMNGQAAEPGGMVSPVQAVLWSNQKGAVPLWPPSCSQGEAVSKSLHSFPGDGALFHTLAHPLARGLASPLADQEPLKFRALPCSPCYLQVLAKGGCSGNACLVFLWLLKSFLICFD